MMKEAITDVVVTLRGTSGQGDEADTISVMTMGQLRRTTSGYMLRYQETQTDEQEGIAMTQDIILNMQPGRVSMTRLGDFGATMVFVKDCRFESKYRTPYGDMAMAIYATQVQCDLSPERGSVRLKYQLDLQGSFASMNTIELDYVRGGKAKPC
ncbi:MAG: DUF1934 domain-containing protein [Aristaeellaceae bacterium]